MRGSLFVGMILILCFAGCDYAGGIICVWCGGACFVIVAVFVFGCCCCVGCLVVAMVCGFVFDFWILLWDLVGGCGGLGDCRFGGFGGLLLLVACNSCFVLLCRFENSGRFGWWFCVLVVGCLGCYC